MQVRASLPGGGLSGQWCNPGVLPETGQRFLARKAMEHSQLARSHDWSRHKRKVVEAHGWFAAEVPIEEGQMRKESLRGDTINHWFNLPGNGWWSSEDIQASLADSAIRAYVLRRLRWYSAISDILSCCFPVIGFIYDSPRFFCSDFDQL